MVDDDGDEEETFPSIHWKGSPFLRVLHERRPFSVTMVGSSARFPRQFNLL